MPARRPRPRPAPLFEVLHWVAPRIPASLIPPFLPLSHPQSRGPSPSAEALLAQHLRALRLGSPLFFEITHSARPFIHSFFHSLTRSFHGLVPRTSGTRPNTGACLTAVSPMPYRRGTGCWRWQQRRVRPQGTFGILTFPAAAGAELRPRLDHPATGRFLMKLFPGSAPFSV